jgi:hypothetical protein
MKRLKLKAKPKKLNILSNTKSTTQHQDYDIEIILEQYHQHTKEKQDLPFYKWIKYKNHFPLDENKPILIYDPTMDSITDGISFVSLQHSLYSSYMKYDQTPTHWMRIKKPEV